MDIFKYMNDGACWQAQAVLAYIRGKVESRIDNNVEIEVGRYENTREQGYVFSFRFWGDRKSDGKPVHLQRNYAVYEYRNSDTLCVLISNTQTFNTPNVNEMWKDKGENPQSYQYDQSFDFDMICECGDFIIQDMENYLQDYIVK